MAWIIFFHTTIFNKVWRKSSEDEFFREMEQPSSIMGALVYSRLHVDTFFFMTAFLMTRSLLHKLDDGRSGGKLFMQVICKRLLRITPSLLIALMITAKIMPELASRQSWDTFNVTNCSLVDSMKVMLFLNDFMKPSCYILSWYLSADFQMFIIGSAIVMLIHRSDLKSPNDTLYIILSLSIYEQAQGNRNSCSGFGICSAVSCTALHRHGQGFQSVRKYKL
jgi:peptidoglycan/LPS O-acetylase OafA/YrhL